MDCWQIIFEHGYNACCEGVANDKNPYAASHIIYKDIKESAYNAWQCGWTQAYNDICEGEELRYL